MDWAYFLSILKIIAIDVALSADNAVVIAMAAHRLPPRQRRIAMVCGAGGAIVLRIVFTALVAKLLHAALLRFAGGVMLVWISAKLLVDEEEGEAKVKSADGLLQAVWTIVAADFAMSLDNMLAVGGASDGHIQLLIFGLLASITIIMTCSSLIADWMNKYPVLVTLGAAILALTAGEMILKDQGLAAWALKHTHLCLTATWHVYGTAGHHAHWLGTAFIASVVAGVLLFPRWRAGNVSGPETTGDSAPAQ